jgi:hypothetical protein
MALPSLAKTSQLTRYAIDGSTNPLTSKAKIFIVRIGKSGWGTMNRLLVNVLGAINTVLAVAEPACDLSRLFWNRASLAI